MIEAVACPRVTLTGIIVCYCTVSELKEDLGMFIMFGRTLAPQNGGPTGGTEPDSSATFSSLYGGLLWHVAAFKSSLGSPSSLGAARHYLACEELCTPISTNGRNLTQKAADNIR